MAMLAAIPHAVLAFDHDFRIVYAKLRPEGRSSRRRGATLLNKRITDLAMFDGEEMREAAALALRGEAARFRRRLRLSRGGAPVVCEVRFAPVRGEAGDPAGGVVMWRDISDEVHAEQALSQYRRFEMLGQLALGVAHDLNNVLAVVQGKVEQIGESEALAAPLRRYTVDASEGIRSAAVLLRRLLALGQPSPVVRHSIDVNRALEALAALFKRSLRPGIGLRLALEASLPEIKVPPVQLDTALLNLLLNARDAIGEHGEIVVETRLADDRTRPSVEIAVRDDGTGMTPDIQRRVFEPFFTTKAAGVGTGLGLMMVRRFVEECGGGIEIDTAPGRGTCVRLRLPVT
jgi:signal transduction histidine kinase